MGGYRTSAPGLRIKLVVQPFPESRVSTRVRRLSARPREVAMDDGAPTGRAPILARIQQHSSCLLPRQPGGLLDFANRTLPL